MRQRKRKLEAIKGNTVKALSFTESYGLTADTLIMHTASGKCSHLGKAMSIQSLFATTVSNLLHNKPPCIYHKVGLKCKI